MRKKLRRMAWLIPLGIISFIAMGGAIVMLLWNGIMPEVFGLGLVTFWQALGLLILGRFLLGGLKRRRYWGGPWKMQHAHCHVHHQKHWKQQFQKEDLGGQ
jgi:hypothetical protein